MVICSCFTLLFSLKESNGAAYIVMFLFIIMLGFIGPFVSLVGSLTNMSFQFSINKNWASWTSLVIMLLALVASIVIIFIGISAI